MADNSGGMGAMGVIVGGLLVLVIGGVILFSTGMLGSKSSTVNVQVPAATGAK